MGPQQHSERGKAPATGDLFSGMPLAGLRLSPGSTELQKDTREQRVMDGSILSIQRGSAYCVAHTKSPQPGTSALLTRIRCPLVNEPPHLRGIRHVLEHVLVRHLIEHMGRLHPGSGDIGGSTDHDGILLAWSGPSAQVTSVVSALTDLLGPSPRISDRISAHEITRVRTERQLKEADPLERVMADMGRLVCPGTSLALTPSAVGSWIKDNPVAHILPALAALRRTSAISFSLATEEGVAEFSAEGLSAVGRDWGSFLVTNPFRDAPAPPKAKHPTTAPAPVYFRPERRGLSSVSIGLTGLSASDPGSAHIHVLSDALRYMVGAQTSHGHGLSYESPQTFSLHSREGSVFGLSLRCLDEAILPIVSVIEESAELLMRSSIPELIYSRIVRSNLIHRIQQPAQTAYGAAYMAETQALERPFFSGFQDLAAAAQNISRRDLRETATRVLSSATILLHAKAVPLMLTPRTQPLPEGQ